MNGTGTLREVVIGAGSALTAFLSSLLLLNLRIRDVREEVAGKVGEKEYIATTKAIQDSTERIEAAVVKSAEQITTLAVDQAGLAEKVHGQDHEVVDLRKRVDRISSQQGGGHG